MKAKCSLKGGPNAARIHGLRPEMVVALIIVKEAFMGRGANCVVTSGMEGQHSHGSLHYVGQALDFRTGSMSREQASEIAVEIREGLGVDFDVVVEQGHLHVEWDPKQAYGA